MDEMVDAWPKHDAQLGFGSSDAQMRAFHDHINFTRLGGYMRWNDMRFWDFSVKEKDLLYVGHLNYHRFDKTNLEAYQRTQLRNICLNVWVCLARKLLCLSDGTLINQLEYIPAGWMASGCYETAKANSEIRAEIERKVCALQKVALYFVGTLGDDCVTHVNSRPPPTGEDVYRLFGKKAHLFQGDSHEYSADGTFEFCSIMFTPEDKSGFPVSWPRMLYKICRSKPDPMLRRQFFYEIRHLDESLQQRISDFLDRRGWATANVNQCAMPKKASAKPAKKAIKKEIKKELRVVNVPQRSIRPTYGSIGDYHHCLTDPFMYGNGKKVPDLQTLLPPVCDLLATYQPQQAPSATSPLPSTPQMWETYTRQQPCPAPPPSQRGPLVLLLRISPQWSDSLPSDSRQQESCSCPQCL